jgi:uncharacterized membrane protein
MAEEQTEFEREMQEETMENRTKMTWVIVVAFVVVNLVSLSTGLFTEFGAERLLSISEILFWFDLMCAGVIGAYFGVDIYAKIKETSIRKLQARK